MPLQLFKVISGIPLLWMDRGRLTLVDEQESVGMDEKSMIDSQMLVGDPLVAL